VQGSPPESRAGTSALSSGDEPYLAMKSIRRATPTLRSAETAKSGMNTWFWTALWRPARSSSSPRTPWVEELLHQGVVGLGDVLHQLAVELVHALGQLALGGLLLVVAVPARLVGDDLVAQDVEDPAEAGPGVERDRHREDVLAEVFAGPASTASKSVFGLSSAFTAMIFGRP
jgi:hypothetical protein